MYQGLPSAAQINLPEATKAANQVICLPIYPTLESPPFLEMSELIWRQKIMHLFIFYIFFGFLLRIIIAIWNGFFGPSFGADLDALTFHFAAVDVANLNKFDDYKIGTSPYINFLGFVYMITTDSLFIGSLLSCLAWFISALILTNCMHILSAKCNMQNKIMLVYALLPSSIFITSVTLREPYQLLFVNIAMYAILQIYLRKNILHWFTLILAIVGASSLHGALMSFGIFLLSGSLFLTSMRGKKISWFKIIPFGIIAVCVIGYGLTIFGESAYSLEDGLSTSVNTYQQGLLSIDARTHYKSESEITGIGNLLLSMPTSIFQYLFEPFPWHISAASDLVSLLENILRGWLIWRTWKNIRITHSELRKTLIFIFIAYLVIEIIWSVGTINWGTSIRHHIPSWGLLLLTSYVTCPRTTQKPFHHRRAIKKRL